MFDTNQPAYQHFRDIYAERTRDVLAWAGSGLSAPAGLPTWPQLRAALEKEALAKADTFLADDANARRRRIDAIRSLTDFWLAFEQIRDILGVATYSASVRSHLQPRPDTHVPEAYRRIWKMHVGGVLTLNLDRFAARAFAEERAGRTVHEFAGKDIGSYVHLLKSQHPFIANLHGIIENASSWVFTKADLRALLETPAYKAFVNSVFSTRTVLFIGISADDMAAGGLLAALRDTGVDPGAHFWVTNRKDTATDDWAEAAGLQVIRYNAPKNDHRELNDFFEDLARFLPKDTVAPPVVGSPVPVLPLLPEPAALAVEPPERIRQLLNAHATDIVRPNTQDAMRAFENFCRRYNQAIWNSWYVTTEPPDNVIFGYRVVQALGEGAFGTVFKAEAPDGSFVAVKLLRHDVRKTVNMLGSFRRGVRSMKILSDHRVKGMVPYRVAYELPACVIMDLVDGPNLEQAVHGASLEGEDKLKIALSLVQIIRRGHLLPQRVLHRDIRPQNIMLKDFYSGHEWEVVVLDFDLSWHKDAMEESIQANAAHAYIAPEQMHAIPRVSSRNALVDSFGLGMTLYFLFTEAVPQIGEYRRTEWPTSICAQLERRKFGRWVSMSARLARLIAWATQLDQRYRADAGQIEGELERLRDCSLEARTEYAEMWAEELLARSFGPSDYAWNHDHARGTYLLAGGIEVALWGDEGDRRVYVTLGWASSGEEERRRLDKWIGKAVDKCVSSLRRGGWNVLEKESSLRATRSVFVKAFVPSALLNTKAVAITEALKQAGVSLQFE